MYFGRGLFVFYESSVWVFAAGDVAMDCDRLSENTHNAVCGDGLEHMRAELRCLDLRIQLQVIKQRNKRANPLEQFRGLVLSEEEIGGLLAQPAGQCYDERPDDSSDPEFLAIKRALAEIETGIRQRQAAHLPKRSSLPFFQLSRIFQLTPLEEQCLIICLAPELDKKYEKLYAYLHDDLNRKKPTIGLVLDLLCPTFRQKISARTCFAPQSPLLSYQLLQVDDVAPDGGVGFLSRQLKIDDRIADYLLGLDTLDARLGSVASLVLPQIKLERVTVAEDRQAKIRRFVSEHFTETSSDQPRLMFYFCGPAGAGKKSLAAAISHDQGLALLVADLGRMTNATVPFEEILWRLGREAMLRSAALCLVGIDRLLSDDEQNSSRLQTLLATIPTFSRLTFFCGNRPWRPHNLLSTQLFINIEFPVPDVRARKRLWDRQLKDMPRFDAGIDSGALASKFRFTPGQIEEAAIAAVNLAKWHASATEPIFSEALHATCRSLSNTRLSTLARKINPTYTRQDIVLPPDQMNQLLELCNQARHRHIVYGEWGFDHKLAMGKGLIAMFSGPPGTGKTMAAEVIASELNLDLYGIDLSQVVSKYIGETEKNLDRIFTEAQTSNAILFFDEADALFGKRSEVKDAHDRYANIEIGYLLQKLEQYQEGIVILATNLGKNIDAAFLRRIHFMVEFPFPDEELRESIWRNVFPQQSPLDRNTDFAYLAAKYRLAGGNIRNIALFAAFRAAEQGKQIEIGEILEGVRREYQKFGCHVSHDSLLAAHAEALQ